MTPLARFSVRSVGVQPHPGRLFERDCGVETPTVVTFGLCSRLRIQPFHCTAAHRWMLAGSQDQDLACGDSL